MNKMLYTHNFDEIKGQGMSIVEIIVVYGTQQKSSRAKVRVSTRKKKPKQQ